MDIINEFFSTLFYNVQVFLFGTRVEGEPANYPQDRPQEIQSLDEQFFTWCDELNVGCRSKNTSVFY